MSDSLTVLIVDMEGNQDRYVECVLDNLPESIRNKVKFITAKDEAGIKEDVSDVDIVGTQPPLVNTVPKIKNLKWFMTFSSGFDQHINAGVIPDGVPLVNAPGCQAKGISEFVIMCMLAHVKQFKRLIENQEIKNFERFHNDELTNKTLGIIGLGEIGIELARKAKAFDMRVIGSDVVEKKDPNVDEFFWAKDYEKILVQSDFVSLHAKETPETIGMIGKEQLKAMKDTAYIVNTARASLIDRDALITALNEKWIAGVTMDVWYQRQPLPSYLPADDELWNLENLLVSPHNCGQTALFIPRACKIFSENIIRYVEGRELTNVVKK